VLLVDNRKAEVVELDMVLYHRVRADDDRRFTGRDPRPSKTLFGGAQTSGQENGPVRRAFEKLKCVAIVLFGEYLGRCHHHGLIAVLSRRKHRDKGYDGFSAADVALDQTVHRRIGRHIAKDRSDHTSLGISKLERQQGSDTLLERFADLDHGSFGLLLPLATQHLKRVAQSKELLEYQPFLCRGSKAFVIRHRHVVGRKVDLPICLCTRDEALIGDKLFGKSFGDGVVSKPLKNGVHDLTQTLGLKSSELTVNRY